MSILRHAHILNIQPQVLAGIEAPFSVGLPVYPISMTEGKNKTTPPP